MAKIKILKDNELNTIYPQSITGAIVDANGTNLDTILQTVVTTDAEEEVEEVVIDYEVTANKVTEITEESTDLQYPTAKAVYRAIIDNEEVGIKLEVVTELPTIGDSKIIYLVSNNSNTEKNIYDEYIYTTEWEKIGTTEIDLSNYATKDKYGDAYISLGRRADTGSVGENSVAIGDRTQANGNYSAAIGSLAQANAMATVALGREVRANGTYSVALGEGAIAKNQGEVAAGRWNIEDTTGKVLYTVGNGTSSSARSNAHTIDDEGNAWFQGDIYIGSNSGTNKDEGSVKLTTASKAKSVSDLVGKYNIPTIEYAINYGDLLAGTWTEVTAGTSYTKGSMSITSSSSITDINNAFDNNDNTYAKMTGATIYIDMGEAVYSYWTRYAESFSSYDCGFILSASNDNATWTQIGDMKIIEANDKAWRSANTNEYYRYYKIVTSVTHSNGLGLYTLKLNKCYKEDTLNYDTLSLNNQLENYENGLRCMIEMPIDFVQQGIAIYLNINNLGKKLINGTIEASKKYELVYDGTVFNATEVTL